MARAIGAATRGKNAVQMVGVDSVIAALEGRSLKGGVKARLRVGYRAPHAIYVHENLNISHPVHATHNCGGQAKFLETPARRLRKDMALIVRKYIQGKRGLVNGLYAAGHLLKTESQKIVPVDTGYLKSTAFVIVEKLAALLIGAGIILSPIGLI